MKSAGDHIRNLFFIAGSIAPSTLIFSSSRKIILPTYHTVSDSHLPHICNLYKAKTTKEFINDIDFLLRHFVPIDLNDLIQITHYKKKVNKNYFHLSFDDGLKECYDVIAPILKKKGIPATFFINPVFMDNKELMFRYKASLLIDTIPNLKKDIDAKIILQQILNTTYALRSKLDNLAELLEVDFKKYLRNHKPYMGTDEIKKLIKDGFTIGAHSMDHPQYSQLPFEEQIRQTKESMEVVSKIFNPDHKVFAFPFTDQGVSKKFFDTIFHPANPVTDLTFGVAGIKKDYHPYNLQRIPMEKEFPGNSIIKGEYLYYFFKAFFGKNKITRR